MSEEESVAIYNKNMSHKDAETGIGFRKLYTDICLNLNTLENLEEDINRQLGSEYIGVATHEQYYYPEYFAYQTDYAEKIFLFSMILNENGYRFITCDEMK